MAKPTIFDVADDAGVSASTVSRVLSGGSAKATTRAKVLSSAAKLGYSANDSAKSLAKGETGVIGIITRDIEHDYGHELLGQLVAAIQTSGHRIALGSTIGNLTWDESLIRSTADSTDGLIIVSPRRDETQFSSLCDPATTVIVNARLAGFTSIATEQRSGMSRAVEHLASLGHRRIAYVPGPEQSWANVARSEAFEHACASCDVEPVVFGTQEATYENGENAADVLMLHRGTTAAIAFNDLLAAGMLNRLAERGVSVPDDISVIGIDNSLTARTLRPHLTSISMNQSTIGRRSVQLLLSQLDAKGRGIAPIPDDIELPSPLIIRDSTGPVPLAD